jgi:hypothetical protein
LWGRIGRALTGSDPLAGPPGPEAYHREILSVDEGDRLLARAIAGDAPFSAARLGNNELMALTHYVQERQRSATPWPYRDVCSNAGFFPAADDMLDSFSRLFL